MNERIMYYLKNISSLKEKASAQVAIGLCQDNTFKEVVLCLEYVYRNSRKHDHFRFVSEMYQSRCIKEMRWESVVEDQCRRMTKELPPSLRQGVHVWMHHIALQCICYSRRLKWLFGVSQCFLKDFLTREHWGEDCRLDEENIALSLLEDKRLRISQRYQIACVYCLDAQIPQLWKKLKEKEKLTVSMNLVPFRFSIRLSNGMAYGDQEVLDSVLIWSNQMDGDPKKKLTEDELFNRLAQHATYHGNRDIVKQYWKRLREKIRQQIVIDMALQSLQNWEKDLSAWNSYKQDELTICTTFTFIPLDNFVLPSYHSELIRFFLTQMDEEQQLTFFHKAFERKDNSLLKCFLDWPFQDDFLPTISRLWGIVPKEKYKECIFFLASLCSGAEEMENRYYDYHSLLWKLWETTPEGYKQCVFNDEVVGGDHHILLRNLAVNSQERNEALFRHIFSDQPQEARRAMMHSYVGKLFLLELLEKRKWSFLNWLLEECLTKKEIPSFKLQLIQSEYGQVLCFNANKKTVLSEKVIDIHYDLVFIRRDWEEVQRLYEWFDLSTEEIKELKINTIFRDFSFYLVYKRRRGDKSTLEEPLRWCLTDEEMLKDFKNIAEKNYFQSEKYALLLKYIECIESELFPCLRKEECPEPGSEGVSVKDNGETSCSAVIEDESSPSRKKETSVNSKNEEQKKPGWRTWLKCFPRRKK